MKTKNNNTDVKIEVETKSEKMLSCLKSMAKNEKAIARLQRKIESIKKLNDEINEKFKEIVNGK